MLLEGRRVVAVATPSRVVLLLPLQRLWAFIGVWCVSTDVIFRCQ